MSKLCGETTISHTTSVITMSGRWILQ